MFGRKKANSLPDGGGFPNFDGAVFGGHREPVDTSYLSDEEMDVLNPSIPFTPAHMVFIYERGAVAGDADLVGALCVSADPDTFDPVSGSGGVIPAAVPEPVLRRVLEDVPTGVNVNYGVHAQRVASRLFALKESAVFGAGSDEGVTFALFKPHDGVKAVSGSPEQFGFELPDYDAQKHFCYAVSGVSMVSFFKTARSVVKGLVGVDSAGALRMEVALAARKAGNHVYIGWVQWFVGADGKVSEIRLVAGDPTSNGCPVETLPFIVGVPNLKDTPVEEYGYRIVNDMFTNCTFGDVTVGVPLFEGNHICYDAGKRAYSLPVVATMTP